MKKLLFICLFLFSADLMFGQLAFGPKIGGNFSKLSTDLDSISESMQPGFQIGAFVRVGKKLYLQPEIYYKLSGGIMSGDVADWKQKITIGSLDIPVLVGFKLVNLKAVNVRLLAGPVASFVTNTKIKDVNDIAGPIKTADLETVNWGIQAGGGVDVLFLTLDVRYEWGLNQMIKEISNTSVSLDSKQNSWIISLGYKF